MYTNKIHLIMTQAIKQFLCLNILFNEIKQTCGDVTNSPPHGEISGDILKKKKTTKPVNAPTLQPPRSASPFGEGRKAAGGHVLDNQMN